MCVCIISIIEVLVYARVVAGVRAGCGWCMRGLVIVTVLK